MNKDTLTLCSSKQCETYDALCIGDIFYDLVFLLDDSPTNIPQGGIAYCPQMKLTPGGIGNVAAGVSALGGSAYLMGRSGNDVFSEMYAQDLKQRGVDYHMLVSKDSATGILASLVDASGERSFVVHRGANDGMSFTDILPALKQVKAKFLFTAGYSFFAPPQNETIISLIKHFKERNTKVIFDPAVFNLVKVRKKYYEAALEYSDVLLPNAEEAKELSGEQDLMRALCMLSEHRTVILKIGRNGCIAAHDGDVICYPGSLGQAVDTTGAGDAFAAAVIFGFSHGYELEDVLKLATWFSGKKVESVGPRSYPPPTDIAMFLNKVNGNSRRKIVRGQLT
ncbi:MAG: carbohydrate kinase family protein [Thaumarchaeota archaeon]|nr:carbohydrate kinase family protein [Nitrososphaerota archaeon]MCL5317476.1 carbohydrate kinase family protein [Nitrososphaerota archaeon]